jgi:hypothetical protein
MKRLWRKRYLMKCYLKPAAAFLVDVGRTLLAILREVFDETAYARFLKQARIASSRQAYAAFRRERECVQERRPRCC